MDTSIYLAITIGCALFYLLSIFTGGEHDLHNGDLDSGDHGVDTHHDDHSDNGVSYKDFFSIRSFLLFGTGFGAAGAISSQLGFGPWLIPVFGIMTGTFFSWLGIKLFQFLHRQEATTSHSLFEHEGYLGSLTVGIPTDGIGEIQVRDIRGGIHFLLAQSEDGSAIPQGDTVEVVSVTADKLVVRKAEFLPPVA